MPEVNLATYMVSTFFDVAINAQLIINGIVDMIAMGLRPNLSISGPIAKEPNGSDIVTKLAKTWLFFL